MLGHAGARLGSCWAIWGHAAGVVGPHGGYVSLILKGLGAMLGHLFGTNGFNTAFWTCVGLI